MAELLTERIRRNARELKLYGLDESADSLVERAERGKLGYREFLDLVLEDEVSVLEGRRYASRLKLSAVPHRKTLDEFDVGFQPARRGRVRGVVTRSDFFKGSCGAIDRALARQPMSDCLPCR